MQIADTKKKYRSGRQATVNCNLSFLVAEIFVFLNYSKIGLLRQENIRIMLAVLLLEKGQKLCSIPQIMPKIMLAQSARAYLRARARGFGIAEFHEFLLIVLLISSDKFGKKANTN